MASLEVVRGELADAHRDTRLNLQSVLESGSLTPEQRWGVAVACAFAARNEKLKEAILHEARQALGEKAEPVVEDARAAASLMGMNNVYYRFRHMVGKESYSTKRAGLRMNRLVQVLTNKVDFELVCLAVSAINGCEMCVQSHEKVVIEGGLSEDQVHDAVRIASVVHAAAVGLES
ncbi:carboxymuconolactone decarboxylase family protein [Archangium violaceum]|jgi:lipoyl-dependent peroxiredoxin subunit D|uniref:carboxymuconolactone decarboxylase family protein n=1 Tax=Archangium violaceum TaxID=83451 RepID=UPI001951CE65|nr:carboxymuconolactone decarboxylase family protein [Archangium violaceum]QRN95074.1 carboxymuconolactone decarboxylase family protein [Archangium violaceum]